jgi:drug/metabolite transporter (DMT)-like permease
MAMAARLSHVFSAVLACAASLAWGSADFLAGVSCRRLGLMTILFVSQVVGMALVLPVLSGSGEPMPGFSYLALAALAGAFNAAALSAFYRGLARGPMGLVSAIAATEAVIPLAFGLLRGERPTVLSLAGIGLAVVGVVIASGAVGEAPSGQNRRSSAVTAGLGVIAAVCFGVFVITLRQASQGGALWAATVSRGSTIALLVAALPLTRSKFATRLSRRDVTAILAIGTLDVTANVLLALATTTGAISLVGVLSSFYPVVTIVLARLVLRERLGSLQRLGTLGALAGVTLIALR